MMSQVKIENAEIREAVERARRDHVHDWALELEEAYGGQFYCAASCTICHLEMPTDETNRRLNATERVSAEDAREISSEVHSAWWPLEGTSPYEDDLRAYAAALEDEDAAR